MKRQIQGKGTIKAPEPMKAVERQFSEAIQYMVTQMAKRYKSQVFKQLDKTTVDKFEDAQTGNFANVFLRLADKSKRRILNQFDDDRLDELAKAYTGKVDKRNRDEFYKRVEAKIGISRKELESTEGLTFQINAYKAETYQWLRKMRDDTLQEWTSNTLRQMAEGKGLEEILSEFEGMVEKRKGHAKMVARTQISTFNALTTKARAQNLGITQARWVTAKDERVRHSHEARHGKVFDLSEGLYSSTDGKTLLPGTDYQCRCTEELILPDDDAG